MKLKAASGIMLTLLLMGMLTLAFNVQIVEANPGTVYIRADGSIDPPTANITTLDNVTYTFTGNINESIVIRRDNIVVDGAGYTVQGTGSGTGINFNRINVTIENAIIKGFDCGISIAGSSNNVFKNTITNNNEYGLFVGEGSNNNISGNTLTANGWFAIDVVLSSNNSFSGNNITANNGKGIVFLYSHNNSVYGNNITANSEDGIEVYGSDNNRISGNNIAANDWEGIDILRSSNNNTISGNNLTNNGNGIYLVSSFNTVSGNTFIDDGLNVGCSYQNTVENNVVNGKPLVYLEDLSNYAVDDAGQVILVRCDNITVEGLNLSRTTKGVKLCETSNSTISGNRITNNRCGIHISSGSPNNTVSGNNLTNNGNGIYVSSPTSPYNSISENNITNNEVGIYLANSINNKFYHNNLIDNTIQAVSYPYPSTYVNIWDDGYPSGGNYWSNYSGTDSDNDGIGDSPYNINVNNRDRYPLMKPYGGPHDIGILLSVSKTAISEGYNTTVTMNVTIINYGVQSETFNFTFDIDPIFHEQNMTVISRDSTVMNFTWNNTGLPRGSYPIYANTTLIPGETDTTDNNIVSWILITIEGDVDGDRDVDGGDQRKIQNAMFAEPGGSDWDANADVDCDGDVDSGDQRKCQNHMFESW